MAPPLLSAEKRSAFGTAAVAEEEEDEVMGAAEAGAGVGVGVDVVIAEGSNVATSSPFLVLFHAKPVVWCCFT